MTTNYVELAYHAEQHGITFKRASNQLLNTLLERGGTTEIHLNELTFGLPEFLEDCTNPYDESKFIVADYMQERGLTELSIIVPK